MISVITIICTVFVWLVAPIYTDESGARNSNDYMKLVVTTVNINCDHRTNQHYDGSNNNKNFRNSHVKCKELNLNIKMRYSENK